MYNNVIYTPPEHKQETKGTLHLATLNKVKQSMYKSSPSYLENLRKPTDCREGCV